MSNHDDTHTTPSLTNRSYGIPPKAVLAIALCDRCADRVGAKENSERYRDLMGRFVEVDYD